MTKLLPNEKGKQRIEIPIRSLNPIKYYLIPIKSVRKYFPGYRVPFILKSDIGKIEAYVSSAKSKGVKFGATDEGRYIKSYRIGRTGGLLNKWFEKHEELEIGDKFIIEIKEPFKLYKLDIEKNK